MNPSPRRAVSLRPSEPFCRACPTLGALEPWSIAWPFGRPHALPSPARRLEIHVNGPAPAPPYDVAVSTDATGATLSWRQPGQVDGWTVYCDFLDGTETESVYVTQPSYRFGDLGPGEHEFGVVAWRSGKPSPGSGTWVSAVIPHQPDDAPMIPVVVETLRESDTLVVTWISQDTDEWELRVIDDSEAVLRVVTCDDHKSVRIGELRQTGRLGVQVRALADGGASSAWSEAAWAQPVSG